MSTLQSIATESLAKALQQAMQCQQQGQLDAAQALYQQVLADNPQQADALHLLGVLHAQRRDFVRAHDLIWQAITVNTDEAMFHNNLANVCVERGLLDEAEPLYVRAIELDNARIDALSNLGLLMSRTDREEAAETLLARAVELDPGNPDWRQNLANLYLRLGRIPEALQLTHDGLITAPRSRVLKAMLAQAYQMFGKPDLAAEVLRAWIRDEPDDPYPHHHLPACIGEQVPERASDGYVVSVFDSFARSFDAKLQKLSYQAPALVAAEVAGRCGPPSSALAALDAGCEGLFAASDSGRFEAKSGGLLWKKLSGFGFVAVGEGKFSGDLLIATRSTQTQLDWLSYLKIAMQMGPGGLPVPMIPLFPFWHLPFGNAGLSIGNTRNSLILIDAHLMPPSCIPGVHDMGWAKLGHGGKPANQGQQVKGLIGAIFSFLGRKAAQTADVTVAFLRWVLELLFSSLRVMAERALAMIR